MMQKKLITHIAAVVLGFFVVIAYSSCHKTQQYSTITYVNDAYTDISISVNGVSKTIPVGGSVSYTGAVSSNADLVASTSGTFGAQYPWSYTDVFHADANTELTKTLDVDPSYFFLEATNSYSYSTTQIEVNVGLVAQTIENISIPNDGNTYQLGYYQAFGNTAVKSFYSDLTTWTSPYLAIPNTYNASYTITLQ